MKYDFDPVIAKDVGVEEAIMYSNIKWWCEKNKANGKHYYDGYYWTYNSMEAFCKLFTFWSKEQIKRIIYNLENKGYLKTGEYNSNKYDRTKRYAPLVDFQHLSVSNDTVGEVEGHTHITYTDNKPDNKTYRGGFHPPTLEEVIVYCNSRGNNVDPQKWWDFYASKGRMVGKNKMKDWHAAVRTWEKPKDLSEIVQEYRKSQEGITSETKAEVWQGFIKKYGKETMQKVLDEVNKGVGTFIFNI